MSLPNFLIVGAAKTGTTSVVSYLRQHPDIFFPSKPKPKFFSAPDNTFPHTGPGDELIDSWVVKDVEEYKALFEQGRDATARGEASTDSIYFPGVPGRIKQLVPDANIFIFLRNPIDRCFSNYMHMVRDGHETLSFEEALQAEEERRSQNWQYFWRYKDLSFFYPQVKRYFDVFGPEQVHVKLFEDLLADPKAFCASIFRTLGVDATFQPDFSGRKNVSGAPRSRLLHQMFNAPNPVKDAFKHFMPEGLKKYLRLRINKANLRKDYIVPETREMLLEIFRPDILQLQELIGRDLRPWLRSSPAPMTSPHPLLSKAVV